MCTGTRHFLVHSSVFPPICTIVRIIFFLFFLFFKIPPSPPHVMPLSRPLITKERVRREENGK